MTRWKVAICGEYMKSRFKVQPAFLDFLHEPYFLCFFSGFCTYIVRRLENFDCGNDRSLDLRSYILANRHALMVRHATSYTVSAIRVETMNGPIGINRPQDIG